MSSPALRLTSVLWPLSDAQKGKAGDIQLVADLTDADYYFEGAANGEPGVATGFGFVLLWRADKFVAAQQDFLSCISSNTGYEAFTNGVTFSLSLGNGSAFNTVSFTLYPSDISKLHALGLLYDGANAVLFFNRRRMASLACGFSPAGGAGMYYGRKNSASGFAAASQALGPLISFRGTPTDAQLIALMDALTDSPIVPPKTMAGSTVTHVWSARKEFASKTLTPWQSGPVTLYDTVTSDKTGGLTRQGTPKYLPVSKSYPLPLSIRGVQGFVAGAYLEAGTAGIRGSASGLTVAALVRITAAGNTNQFIVCNTVTAANGWTLYLNGTGNLNFFLWGASTAAWQHTLVSADLGRVLFVVVAWDGTSWRGYIDGVQDGATTTPTFVATTGKMRVGLLPDGTGPADNAAVFAVAGCDQGLTAAEIATMWQKVRSTGRLTLPAGKTNPHEYNFEQDYVASGGSVPSSFLDRSGTDNLTRTGTLTRAQRVSGQLASQSFPFTWGLQGLTDAAYYSGSIGVEGGISNGKSWAFLLRITSQAVTSTDRFIVYARRGTSDMMYMKTNGTNAAIYLSVHNGTSAIGAPLVAVNPSDVGRLMLVVLQYDKVAALARSWAKRAQVSSGTACGGFLADAATTLYAGRYFTAGYPANPGIDFLGMMSGDYTWTRGEIEQLFDDVEANKDLVDVPGKTAWRYSVRQSQPDYTLGPPASLVDQISLAKPLTKTGTAMTISPVHADIWTT